MAIDRVKRRLRGRSGFTLAEMMICMVILLLATAAVTNTLIFAMNQVSARTRESEAEVLSNTLSMELRSQLTCAGSVTADDSGKVTVFTSGADGADGIPCAITESDGKLYITYYQADLATPLGSFALVRDEDYLSKGSKPLSATHTLTWDNTAQRFSVTLKITDGEKLNLEKSFQVSPIQSLTS